MTSEEDGRRTQGKNFQTNLTSHLHVPSGTKSQFQFNLCKHIRLGAGFKLSISGCVVCRLNHFVQLGHVSKKLVVLWWTRSFCSRICLDNFGQIGFESVGVSGVVL